MRSKAVTCPRCQGLAKPTVIDRFEHCPCGAVFAVKREDGLTCGGPDGWRLVDEDE